ncbi:hypothetical protein [Brevibacillus borstelensis]|uniref:hypothetical protein n=1 Tax=Brevibacillus borstelensis TaxID=45462 RepID=UPI002E1FD8EE|nr:hypothetical protein [Brevibacillus borstelensis]
MGVKVAVLYAGQWGPFADERTGEMRSGTTVIYCDAPEDGQSARGYKPIKESMTLEDFGKFTQVPGIYDVDFRRRAGANGKAVTVMTGVKLVKPLTLGHDA